MTVISLLIPAAQAAELELAKDARVVLLGNGLGSRMLRYGHFETELHRRYPEHHLVIRNLCDEGETPAFRPNAGRESPWAFPGGERFRPLVESGDRWGGNSGDGHFPEPDAWLKQLKPDIIVAFFGFNESFEGPAGAAGSALEARSCSEVLGPVFATAPPGPFARNAVSESLKVGLLMVRLPIPPGRGVLRCR